MGPDTAPAALSPFYRPTDHMASGHLAATCLCAKLALEFATMPGRDVNRANTAIGLSATQLGDVRQVFVVDLPEGAKAPQVFINRESLSKKEGGVSPRRAACRCPASAPMSSERFTRNFGHWTRPVRRSSANTRPGLRPRVGQGCPAPRPAWRRGADAARRFRPSGGRARHWTEPGFDGPVGHCPQDLCGHVRRRRSTTH